MGVGKTTVGKALARLAGMHFIDCDQELEQRTGVSISTIFDIEGEDGFRRRETELLQEIVGGDNQVIATGGGVVMNETNRQALARGGYVIYLTAKVRKLIRRTRNSKTRPLLQTANPERTLTEIMKVREPVYTAVADLVVKVDDRSPQFIARRILETMQENENP